MIHGKIDSKLLSCEFLTQEVFLFSRIGYEYHGPSESPLLDYVIEK